MRKRNIHKWSIRRDSRFGGRWTVHAPYEYIRASYVGDTFEGARRAFIRLTSRRKP